MFIDHAPTPDIAVRTSGHILSSKSVAFVRSSEPRRIFVRASGYKHYTSNEVKAHSKHLIQTVNCFLRQFHLFAAQLCRR